MIRTLLLALGLAPSPVNPKVVKLATTDTLLDEFRRRFAGDEKWMNCLFRNFFLRPTVARAREQPSGP
jgi:hypothetical protein